MKFKIFSLLIILFVITNCQSLKTKRNPDVLWQFISQECIPNLKLINSPAPCSEVTFPANTTQGYVVFKDHKGPLQYLLMPATKITGIEDDQILRPEAVNYFYEAWKARAYLIAKYKKTIPDEEISLAINSERGRSQNQLHIHISCLRSDVKKVIEEKEAKLSDKWELFPGGILNHHYYARKIKKDQLQIKNPFVLLYNDFPDAKKTMGDFGMAVVAVKNDLILLADRFDLGANDKGWAEEIQDHNCPQLYN
jgi:CDP-diacylglycerol pyrophosphatase